MQPQKSSNVKHVGACRGRRCGLHGITIPVSAIALKGVSLPSGRLIGQTDKSVMVIFPDSQQSLPASWRGEVDHVMGLKNGIFFIANMGAYHLQRQILHCHFYFSEMNQCIQGSSPLLYANATICLARSKISTKVVCVHLSARPSARVQWEANILKWGQTPKQVESISLAEHWSKRQSYDLFPVSSVSSRSCDLYLSITRQESSFSLPHLAFTHPKKVKAGGSEVFVFI